MRRTPLPAPRAADLSLLSLSVPARLAAAAAAASLLWLCVAWALA
jgi:hypothetical protein